MKTITVTMRNGDATVYQECLYAHESGSFLIVERAAMSRVLIPLADIAKVEETPKAY